MGNSVISTMAESINTGSLHLKVGPMYAGKTSKLIETYEECLYNDEKTIVLTHSAEIRYSIDKLSTHDQKKISCFKCESIKSFMNDYKDEIESCKFILIDEGQFFHDLTETLYLVNTLNKHLFVFGLDGDFQRNKFGQILDLIPHCDTVEKMSATCSICRRSAIFSDRMNESTEQTQVGSCGMYRPLCRECYNSNITH